MIVVMQHIGEAYSTVIKIKVGFMEGAAAGFFWAER